MIIKKFFHTMTHWPVKSKIICEERNCHISIDDTVFIFNDITIHSEYKSIFDNSNLRFLKDMHDNYGSKVVMFVFDEFGGVSLENCTNRFTKEFIENSDWLKFGFHAKDANAYQNTDVCELLQNYDNANRHIKNITGRGFEAEAIRLDRFCGTYDQLHALYKNFGIKGYFTADQRGRHSYYLTEKQEEELISNDICYDNGLVFTRSDIRVENLSSYIDLKRAFNKHKWEKNLVIFTHETCLNEQKIKRKLRRLIVLAKNNKYRFSENILEKRVDGENVY